jgi:hypothetical protein
MSLGTVPSALRFLGATPRDIVSALATPAGRDSLAMHSVILQGVDDDAGGLPPPRADDPDDALAALGGVAWDALSSRSADPDVQDNAAAWIRAIRNACALGSSVQSK